jgi:glycosyltransferase involved in cell wall biosynthesis
MAWVASKVGDVPYGVTVHAVDIYLNRFLCRKLRDAALRVTVCEYNIREITARCPELDSSDFLLKYAGVDLDDYKLDGPRPSRPAREIVAVGRITPKKGFDHLVSAMAALRASGRDVRCRIVGTGGPIITERLRQQIAELGLEGDVELLGAQPPSRVRQLMVEADIVAAPCTIAPWGDRDSMPVVLKEAMAMEIPVVATNDFGIPELVPPDAGILVSRDDVDALVDGLSRVLDLDAEARARMGRAGRAAVARFSEAEGARALAGAFAAQLAR